MNKSLLALCLLLVAACNRTPAPAPAPTPAAAGSGSGAAPAAPAPAAAAPLLPPPDLSAWVAPAGFTKGAAVAPDLFVPQPPGALAAAARYESESVSVEALAVRYPSERYARPHVSDVNTPDPGGSKLVRRVVQRGSLVVEVRGSDAPTVARFIAAVANGLGVAAPAAGSGEAVGR